jgi:glycosyltransferase involved in cell wall biosynthesis
VEGRKKEELYLRTTVYVLPSYYEGMPRSLLEAMSYGLPIVTTDINGVSDLVQDGIDGLLIKPGDIQGLAHKIIMLLRDEPLRVQLANNARVRIQKEFNVEDKLYELEMQLKKLI